MKKEQYKEAMDRLILHIQKADAIVAGMSYAIPGFEACPFHKAGQVFVSDGEHKPEGLCQYAWEPMKEMVKMLSEGELLQPRGTWMVDDDKGIFSCVDGLRPVIMLIEAIHTDKDERNDGRNLYSESDCR